MKLILEEKVESYRIPPRQLEKKEHGQVLCYPGTDLSSFALRVKQLKELGVEQVNFEGDSKVGKFGIIGKGCVSIVVKAVIGGEIAALKIRRVDANRPSVHRDYELQKLANSFGVGPKAISCTDDLFAMEYIDALKIGRWFASLKTRTPKKQVRTIVRDVLTQCYLLDSNGLDHGELSNPSKHVLLRKGTNKPVIIDYESASTTRRPSNLTAVAAFLFLSAPQSEKLLKIVSPSEKRLSRSKLISLLGRYKKEPTENSLERVLSSLHI